MLVFRIHMPKRTTAQRNRAVNDFALCVAIESTFCDDDPYRSALKFIQLFVGEVSAMKGASETCEVDGEIIRPRITLVEWTGGYKYSCLVALRFECLKLFGEITSRVFVVSECLMGGVGGSE
jgi:hypothetical protein